MATTSGGKGTAIVSNGVINDTTGGGALGSVSKVMSSLFMTAADPNLTKVSTGGKTPSAINSKLLAIGGSKLDNLIQSLGSAFGSFGGFNFMDLVDSIDLSNGFSVDIDKLAGRLGGPIGEISSAVSKAKEMVEEVKKDAVGALMKYGGALGGDIGGYIQMGAETYRLAKDADLGSIDGLLSVAGKVLGGTALGKLIDSQAETMWIASLIRKAQELKLPQALQVLANKLKGNRNYTRSLTSGIQFSVNQSDIATLSYLSQVIDGQAMESEYPKIINHILKHYKFPEGYTFEKQNEYLSELLSTLTRINPNWDKSVFNNEWIDNLEPWLEASKDARILFQGTKYELSYTLAKSYPDQTINSLLRKQYRHYYPA